MENLKGFFNPQSIAVVGASEREDSIGTKILRNLTATYSGSVFPINPFRSKIQGVTAYPSIDRAPFKADLAIIATPAHTIPQVLEECGKAGVWNIIIVSAGFDECNQNGQDLMRQIIEHKKTYGLKILGPNSYGIIRPKLNLYATFNEKKAVVGKIAFISQSAALCGSVLDWSSETQVGLSAVVSTGSMIGIDVGDLIDYFGQDPQTRTIMLYLESIKNIRKFISAARGYAKSKPIILLKSGRYKQSLNLSLSPLKELSEDDVYDAAFKRSGIVRVETIGELFDCAKTLTMQSNPCNPELTIITNAGGPGLIAVDQLNARFGKLAQLSKGCIENLKTILPYYCAAKNPIDILEEANPDRFRGVIQTCLSEKTTSNILVIFTPQGSTDPASMSKAIIDSSKQAGRNLLVCLMGEDSDCQQARRMLHKNGFPTFRTPEEAVKAFMYTYSYTQNLELLYQTPQEIPIHSEIPVFLKGLMRRAFIEGRQVLNLDEALKVLEAYKIPIERTLVAKTVEEALKVASEAGYPVAVKGLNLSKAKPKGLVACSAQELSAKFNQISNLKEGVEFEFQGVAVQSKRNVACKLFLGYKKDKAFGAIIFIGNPETCSQDGKISVGFPPLNQVLARHILEDTRIPRLNSAHQSLEEVLTKFSQLIIDFPEIAEATINLNLSGDYMVKVVDGWIHLDSSRIIRESADHHHEHLAIAPYPIKYITERTLKNRTKVTFRPIKPEDEGRFNELFKSLSQESVRFRFCQTIREMSHDSLSRYCNIDYDREIAIVAELEDGRIIGVVRLALEAEGKKAEFAITVSDAWQGQGLGSKLTEFIIGIAEDLKLQNVYMYITPKNQKMINLSVKSGFKTTFSDEYTVIMTLELS